MDLEGFIDRVAATRWLWGVMDCTLMPADWCRIRRGVDPAAAFRGRYRTAEEARALIDAEGGYVPMIRHAMDGAGLAETGDPRHGDVGIILAPVARLQHELPVCGTVGAIRFHDRWVVRAARGLRFEDFPSVAAWRVG